MTDEIVKVVGFIVTLFAVGIFVMAYFWSSESASVPDLTDVFVVVTILLALVVGLTEPFRRREGQ